MDPWVFNKTREYKQELLLCILGENLKNKKDQDLAVANFRCLLTPFLDDINTYISAIEVGFNSSIIFPLYDFTLYVSLEADVTFLAKYIWDFLDVSHIEGFKHPNEIFLDAYYFSNQIDYFFEASGLYSYGQVMPLLSGCVAVSSIRCLDLLLQVSA